MVANSQTAFCSEIMALWAVAWMENLMPRPLPTQAEMEHDVALVNAWIARRYFPRGLRDPEIIIEIQTFFDIIMADLGLTAERRRRGIFGGFKEWVMPYHPADYAGIVDEFMVNARSEKA